MSRIPEIDRFVEKQLELVELERRAEVEQGRRQLEDLSAEELERRGVAVMRLRIVEEDIGLGGRSLLRLARGGDDPLPSHRLSPGDIVSVRTQGAGGKSASPVTGVVWRLRRDAIIVSIDDTDTTVRQPIRLDRVSNDVSYRRLRDAMGRLQGYEKGPTRKLREVLFGRREPSFDDSVAREVEASFFDDSLDASQKEAVALASSARDVALIHGPPGTGKTTAVVELIRQSVRRGEKVLACAPSNVAVDNVVERLARHGVRVVRTGHPARLLPAVVEHSLDALVSKAEGTKIAGQMRREIREAAKLVRRAKDRAERRACRDDLHRLRAELREIENRTVRQIIADADVVLSTLTSAADPLLSGVDFDLSVIDEAAQSIEAACWIPILRCRRLVLAGDHQQLPPTVISRAAAKGGLTHTLFERLTESLDESTTRMLTMQYRMHERIMQWSSDALYDGKIVAHGSVQTHLLEQIDGVASTDDTSTALLLIDTAGCDFEEEREATGDSRANQGEAGLVKTHVSRLIEAGVRGRDIAVITPYNAQVGVLRERLSASQPEIEIGSVDGFQGREKEAVVISLVRSNPRGDVGFLSDDRRLNVAVTRARRHVAVIGDSATVSHHPFLAGLIEHFQTHGEYRSAWEYR